jgi:hypothetical protein
VDVNKKGYVAVLGNKTKKRMFVKMSRMIMGVTDPKIFVDHKDRNPLNNCRINLRICIASQNLCNTTSAKNSTSKYLGVSWSSDSMKWMAQIVKNNKHFYLGRYKIEEDAALAYNKAAIEIHGEFANLNIIE